MSNHHCQECGHKLTEDAREFHHIVGVAMCYEFRRIISINWARSIENIKVLCHDCHTAADNEMQYDWLANFIELTGMYFTYSQIASL